MALLLNTIMIHYSPFPLKYRWGSYFGENGFFRIVRGVNNMNLESDCYWAVPKFDESELRRGAASLTTARSVEDVETNHALAVRERERISSLTISCISPSCFFLKI